MTAKQVCRARAQWQNAPRTWTVQIAKGRWKPQIRHNNYPTACVMSSETTILSDLVPFRFTKHNDDEEWVEGEWVYSSMCRSPRREKSLQPYAIIVGVGLDCRRCVFTLL